LTAEQVASKLSIAIVTAVTTDPPQEKPAKPAPLCPCGHDKHHVMVSANPDYTFGGWVLNLIGISAHPRAVNFECRRCGKRIERSTDPADMARTIGGSSA
jgi:hypothetical protein